ncbi:MAG: hypothetical protein IT167_29930 [Bryobacterales bacterium]|nr:hypothetical protein [Bryobacterales bacterium]
MTCLFLLLLLTPGARPQSLRGVVDIHAHSGPDSTPRSIDALNLVRLAREKGFRGLVLKNHYEPTEAWAALARQEVPGIEVFGGIALNLTVGGINPAAVERMTRVQGGFGKVVWMPTYDSRNHVRVSGENRPFVPVSKDGKLLPGVLDVIRIIAQHHLVLATGHSSPAEVLMMVKQARDSGVSSVVVTHAMLKYVGMSVPQMKEAAAMGAMIEFVGNAVVGTQKEFTFPRYADAMRQVGFGSVILSSDFGQKGNPLHPDGLEQVFRGLRGQGVTVDQIDQIVKTNPAKLLGIR